MRNARPSRGRALWVSSTFSTYGGIATFVRNMRETEIWAAWNVRHVATHCDGSMLRRIAIFAVGFVLFIKELLIHRPDVVHLHTSERGSFIRKGLLLWVSKSIRIRVILHMHGPEFYEFAKGSRPIAQKLIRLTLEEADSVIALGNSWAELLLEVAPRARVVVIPNSIRPQGAVRRPASGPVNVLFLGELCSRKGISILLNSWVDVLSSCESDSVKLTVAGWGEIERARNQVSELGIKDSVDICGWLDKTEVAELLAITDVLVLPSIKEGQPMSILEAMARGICVVSTTAGGIPEMIGNGEGVLVRPGDADELSAALVNVIKDANLREQLGYNALLRIKREFDSDEIARKFDDLYFGLVN